MSSMQQVIAATVSSDTIAVKSFDNFDGIVHLFQVGPNFYIDIIDLEFGVGPYGETVGPLRSLEAATSHKAWLYPGRQSLFLNA